MTVKELIKRLLDLPRDAEVRTMETNERDGTYAINEVIEAEENCVTGYVILDSDDLSFEHL